MPWDSSSFLAASCMFSIHPIVDDEEIKQVPFGMKAFKAQKVDGYQAIFQSKLVIEKESCLLYL